MPRVYKRKFDWDEARIRYEAGETLTALAREYGVSVSRVHQVVNEEAGLRVAERARAYNSSGSCVRCGAQIWRCGNHDHCRECASLERATSVRPDALRCVTCREWKPDTAFPHNRTQNTGARRGRHSQCQACQTVARRNHRQRNREASNKYDREYKARRRAEARA